MEWGENSKSGRYYRREEMTENKKDLVVDEHRTKSEAGFDGNRD